MTNYCRARYASAVLGVVILSVRLSVRHTRALWLIQEPTGDIFISFERAIILVFCCRRSQRNSNGVTPNGGAKERWGRLKRRFSTNIPGTADRLKRCKLKRDTHSRIIRPYNTAVLHGRIIRLCNTVAVRLQYRRHFPPALRPGSTAVQPGRTTPVLWLELLTESKWRCQIV